MHHVEVKPAALKAMLEHGKSQLENELEVGGVITGRAVDGSVLVTHAIPLSIGQKTTVEITPELFSEAYERKEESGIKDPIIGWYHSHPGYSCFMSKMDETAHRSMLNLYKDAIALVLDPSRYTEREPSNEYFKVFTLSDGKVVEIPSDIDGSRESKDEMFRGFFSGKETVVERVIYKPEGRSWIQIASVALLASILVLGFIASVQLSGIREELSAEKKSIGEIPGILRGITGITGELNNLKTEFQNWSGKIDGSLVTITKMVERYSFEMEVVEEPEPFFLGEPTQFTITVKNTGNVSNKYTVEILDFPTSLTLSPSQFDLEPNEEEKVTIKVSDSFEPANLSNPVTIQVTPDYGNSESIPVNLVIKPRITFKIGGQRLNLPQLEGNTFTYSYPIQLKLGQEKYTVEIVIDPASKKDFSLSYSLDKTFSLGVTVNDTPLNPNESFQLKEPVEPVTLLIKPSEGAGSFTLTITITSNDGKSETYILELTFE